MDIDALIAAHRAPDRNRAVAIDAPKPVFEVVELEPTKTIAPRAVRRNWQPVVQTLASGKVLFMTDDELSAHNIRYLSLAFRRRGLNEHLHVQREERDGVRGRLLWLT